MIAALCTVLHFGCRASAPADEPKRAAPAAPPRPSEPPDVVLITVDTIRADYVDAQTTPFITRFGKEGVVFTQAQSMFTETGPAHASLLTGLQPHQHGVIRNAEKFDYPGRIPTAFYKAGYQTAGFVSAVPVRKQYGFGAGFEVFNDEKDPKYIGINTQRSGGKTVDATAHWLARRDAKRPMFLWVHLFDAHAPYDPEDLGPGGKVVTRDELDAFMNSKTPVPEVDKQRIRDMYRRELMQTDQQVERLHDAVVKSTRRGIIWVVLGDHGEELFDHGNFAQHDQSLYQGVLRVPLIVRWDGYLTPHRIDTLVNSGAVAATLMSLAGLSPLPHMLAPLTLDSGPVDGDLTIVSRRSPHGRWVGGPASAVRRGDYKAIFYQSVKAAELYDLAADPGEQRNLSVDRADLLNQMKEALTAAAPMVLNKSKAKLDDETKHALQQLGYTTGD